MSSNHRYLDATHVANTLKRFTYKPGFSFEVFTHPYEGLCVAIRFSVPDSTKSLADYAGAVRAVSLQHQCVNVPVPPIISAEHLFDWIEWRCRTIEIHELCEFAKVDGTVRHDPHSEEYWGLRA